MRPEAPKPQRPKPISGPWIRMARLEIGWTQRQLAEALGMPASTVCKWELEYWTKTQPYLRLAIQYLMAVGKVPAKRRKAIELAAEALAGGDPDDRPSDSDIDGILADEEEISDERASNSVPQ